MSYTPGKWRYYTEPQPNGCPIVGADGLMVAMLAHSVNHPDQKETALANAGLIAAAPDLLEALERAERKLSAYVGVCTGDKELTGAILPMARAAIAKARIE